MFTVIFTHRHTCVNELLYWQRGENTTGRNDFWSNILKQSYLIFSLLITYVMTASCSSFHYCPLWYYRNPHMREEIIELRENWTQETSEWVSSPFWLDPLPPFTFCHLFHRLPSYHYYVTYFWMSPNIAWIKMNKSATANFSLLHVQNYLEY